jgi:diacylglycerol O-acyltransferase / wax synthase
VSTSAWFQRLGPGDVQAWATDVGPVPMNVGAVLILDAGPDFDLSGARRLLATRLAAIPRLRQALVEVPLGCGRPVWVDDPGFDVDMHLEQVRCGAPGDRASLLDTAVAAVTTPLDRARPLWRALLVTDLADHGVGVVFVLHHVVADGIGGLAVLAGLVDEAAGAGPSAGPPLPDPRPAPTARQLLVDSWRTRLHSVRRISSGTATLRAALAELGRHRPDPAPRTSLNVPTGARRRVTTVEADLAAIREVAHAHGATVNDVMLLATSGALHTLLARRGEDPPDLVISVPISARTGATTATLGNHTGVMPVRVPTNGSPEARLGEIARITAAQRTTARGSSAALVAPAFRLLAAVGLFRPLIDRQRLVNSFLTNIRGPAAPLTFHGVPITQIVPVTITAGNVTVAFAILSYAGTLTTTVIVDPDAVPDVAALATALRAELGSLAGMAHAPGPPWHATPPRPGADSGHD